MAINNTHWVQKLLLCSSLIFASAEAKAQITPDNTLGTESSRVTPNTLINGSIADKIEAGAQRGSNLFHSFSEFNIDNGQRVYFANPEGVVNILTRVTGGNASNPGFLTRFEKIGVKNCQNVYYTTIRAV